MTCTICENAYETFRLADDCWDAAEDALYDGHELFEQCEVLRHARNVAEEAWNTAVEAHRWGAHE